MKKIWQTACVVLLFISFSENVNAQDFDDSGLMAMVDFELFEAHNTEFNSKTKSEISFEERMAKAKTYDQYVSKEFGSYLNPYNGNLYIINNDKKQFNRAQLMKECSKENVFSIKIDQEMKSINIEDYDSGEYMLILSNEEGDILVEKFVII